jgi:hypothetical protein
MGFTYLEEKMGPEKGVSSLEVEKTLSCEKGHLIPGP